MKQCSYCGKEYPDHLARCPLDNALLVSPQAGRGTDWSDIVSRLLDIASGGITRVGIWIGRKLRPIQHRVVTKDRHCAWRSTFYWIDRVIGREALVALLLVLGVVAFCFISRKHQNQQSYRSSAPVSSASDLQQIEHSDSQEYSNRQWRESIRVAREVVGMNQDEAERYVKWSEENAQHGPLKYDWNGKQIDKTPEESRLENYRGPFDSSK